MCAPNPPPAPDYQAAAKEQGAANIAAAKAQGKINNPNVISPYGTQKVTYGEGFDDPAYQQAVQQWNAGNAQHMARYGVPLDDPSAGPTAPPRPTREMFTAGDPDQATITQQFSPEQQRIFDLSNQAKIGLGEVAGQGTEALKGVVGRPIDFSGAPPQAGQSEDVRKRVLEAMMSRVNEDYGRKSDDMNSNLIAAGLRPGSKAYDDQMALLARTRTDANTQAELAAQQAMSSQFGLDTQARKDAIAEMLMQRQVPLNEITALMSGSQVNNPFAMPTYAQNAQVGAAPVYGATADAANYASDLYNVRAQQAGNLQSGLFGLGGAALMGGGMAMSDRRLKTNIQRVGNHYLGIGIYEYDIAGRHERGVMADELLTVKPNAVLMHPDGYYRVDYAQIGGRP